MNYLRPLMSQFAALTLRERMLAIAALLGVIYFLFDLTVVRPQRAPLPANSRTCSGRSVARI